MGTLVSPAAPRLLADEATERAIRYLEQEVPRWHRENNCFSCHNNGDAARALYVVAQRGSVTARDALSDTLAWLERPADWKDNGGLQVASDKRLAAIQFAFSLLSAQQAGLSQDRSILTRAAELVASHQEPDGSWPIDVAGSVGSPATYGATLATTVSRQVLAAADRDRFGQQLQRADHWLLEQRPARVLDAAALLIALKDLEQPLPSAAVQHCLDVLRRGAAPTGGWGPFVNSRPEAFDTALTLIALSRWPDAATADMVRCGREFLVSLQFADGSWPETTRPADSESYAQRMSTAGWATLALLTVPAPVEP